MMSVPFSLPHNQLYSKQGLYMVLKTYEIVECMYSFSSYLMSKCSSDAI